MHHFYCSYARHKGSLMLALYLKLLMSAFTVRWCKCLWLNEDPFFALVVVGFRQGLKLLFIASHHAIWIISSALGG